MSEDPHIIRFKKLTKNQMIESMIESISNAEFELHTIVRDLYDIKNKDISKENERLNDILNRLDAEANHLPWLLEFFKLIVVQ